jgi:hypothetical protein
VTSAVLVQTKGFGIGIVLGQIGIDGGLQIGNRTEDGAKSQSFGTDYQDFQRIGEHIHYRGHRCDAASKWKRTMLRSLCAETRSLRGRDHRQGALLQPQRHGYVDFPGADRQVVQRSASTTSLWGSAHETTSGSGSGSE